MGLDRAWDTALINWQPTGSFHEALPTPVHGPAEGTLIQLPCINQEWVLLLMGCLTQLQNPAIWGTIADSIRDQVLSWVTQLQEMMWSGMDVPCCNVAMRLNTSCVLQFSTDGGSTWRDVSGWSDNFGNCVRSNIPAPVPPNPRGDVIQQHACNIAGFLASEIIQKTMVVMESYVGSSNQQVQFAHDVLSSIAFAFPITYAVANAAYDFYQSVVSQLLSQVTTAATDPTLWSEVTCAIYNAIKGDGYVTAANFPVAQANLHAISYAFAWAPNAIGNYWGDLGLTNIQSLQDVGAIDQVDCTDCGTFCHFFDFTVGTMGWFGNPGSPLPSWSSGVGFTANGPHSGQQYLEIAYNLPVPTYITSVCLRGSVPWAASGAAREINCYNGATLVHSGPLPIVDSGAHPTPWCIGAVNAVCTQIVILVDSAQGGGVAPFAVFDSAEITGNGPDPIGYAPCQY